MGIGADLTVASSIDFHAGSSTTDNACDTSSGSEKRWQPSTLKKLKWTSKTTGTCTNVDRPSWQFESLALVVQAAETASIPKHRP
jgi:hypothetical protein